MFLMSLESEDLEIAKLLRGGNIYKHPYALQYAARYGKLEIVKLLIEHGADIHADDDYALGKAAEFGHLEIVKFLFECGANIHADDDEAVSTRQHDVVAWK